MKNTSSDTTGNAFWGHLRTKIDLLRLLMPPEDSFQTKFEKKPPSKSSSFLDKLDDFEIASGGQRTTVVQSVI